MNPVAAFGFAVVSVLILGCLVLLWRYFFGGLR